MYIVYCAQKKPWKQWYSECIIISHSIKDPDSLSPSGLLIKGFMISTFHSSDFASIEELIEFKASGNKSISVVIPALNEAATIGTIISYIRQHFMEEFSLVDEIVVMDGLSEDRTVEISREEGARVYNPDEAGPPLSQKGKGVSLWKSQFVTSGDIVIFIDSDILDFDRRFICGLVGPLLCYENLSFVKAFYQRPLLLGSDIYDNQGGRITEILVRPLLSALVPPLAWIYQPLSGEYAVRRTLLEKLPFWSGYGVEIGLLMDMYSMYGLSCIAQVDMDIRCHRNRNVNELGRTSFDILQVILSKLQRQGVISLKELSRTLLTVRDNNFEETLSQEIELPARITISGDFNNG